MKFETAMAIALFLSAAGGLIGLWWRSNKTRKRNRRTGLPKPVSDPRSSIEIFRRTVTP